METLSSGEGSATASTSSQSLHLPSLASQNQACSLLTCAIQHLFLAKGQISDPIPVLQSRRARERLAKNVDGDGMMGSKSKGESFAKRKRTRKVDELLLAIQRLSLSLLSAMQVLHRNHPLETDFTLLMKFGQSRYSCRQQILISFQDVIHLSLREPNTALQDASIRRKKMAILEKKLVRFLLGLAVEDDDFNKLLNSPIGLTRAHIFLLAPSDFNCQDWLRQQSLKMSELSFQGNKSQQDEGNLDLQEKSDSFTKPMEMLASKDTQESSPDFTDDVDDIDARRLKRMQQRVKQQASNSSSKKRPQTGGLKSTKKQPLSASFVMQCGKEMSEDSSRSMPKDHSWYACKVVLKGAL